MIAALSPFLSGMIAGALMLLTAEVLFVIVFVTLVSPERDDDEGDITSDPNNPFDRERDRRRNKHNNNRN